MSATSIQPFFDDKTWTVSYVIVDHATKCAVIVDPVLDFDFNSGRTSTVQADKMLAYAADEGLKVHWILETHARADHLSGARYLQEKVGGRIAVGERIKEVQATFRKLYNLERNFPPDGAQFDHLFKDEEVFKIPLNALGKSQAGKGEKSGATPSDRASAAALGAAPRLCLSRLDLASREMAAKPSAEVDRSLWLAVLAGVVTARLAFVYGYRALDLDAPLTILDIRDGGWHPTQGL